MRIVVSEDIRTRRAELERLVRDGFQGVDVFGVEIRVERAPHSSQSFTGRAYADPNGGDPTFLVRLRVPGTPRNRGYPRTYRYRDRKTAPWITVESWREAVVALAAHEACHVRQFRDGLRRSEIEAERWAVRVLEEWRAGPRREELVGGPAEIPARPEQLALAW